MTQAIKNIAAVILLLASINSMAQTIMSIEEAGTYRTNNGMVPRSLLEIKDVNNYFDPYIGSWTAIYDNKEYILTVFEVLRDTDALNFTEETISFSYIIKNATTGAVLADSSDEVLGDAYGIKYQPASGLYELFMNMDCGESKTVLLGFQNIDTMSLNGQITSDHRLVFWATNSMYHRPTDNNCPSYSHLIPNELIRFDRL
jgi:hypothetical protein